MFPRASERPAALIGALLVIATLLAGCGSEQRAGVGGRDPRPGDGPTASAKPILSGGERVLFIGDSLAVEAPPNYPQLLPAALGGRAPRVETVNLAEPGTTAGDWAPGGPLFERRLEPMLAGADLVVVTLGGNDLQQGLGGHDGIDSLSGSAAGEAFDAIDRFQRRLRTLIRAIRRRAPEARIVYLGYPDYAEATAWREAAGAGGTIALGIGLSSLFNAASEAGPDLALDMGPATARAGVDSLLADSEHLGPAGHELYARRLAAALTRPR